MLIDLDLEGEKEALLKELAETKSELKPKKIIKRLRSSRASLNPATSRSG